MPITKLRILVALCAIPLSATMLAACGGGVPSGAVVTVGEESIDKKTFEHWLAIAAKSSGKPNAQVPKPPNYAACVTQKRSAEPKPARGQRKTPDAQLRRQCEEEYARMRDQVIQLIVSQRWIEGEASAMGIDVSDSEVKRSFDQQRKQSFPKQADYRRFLKTSGQTPDDILLRVRVDLLSTRIRQKVTKGKDKVTDKQIADYYRKNKAQFATPEQREVRLVLTKGKAKALEAMAALEAGESWRSVAKTYSIDKTSKSKGGKLPAVVEGQQEKALDEAVFKASKRNLTGPVKSQFGYYVFEVTKVRPASQQTLNQATPTLKQMLIAQNQQKALDAFTRNFRKKWKEQTECRDGYVTPDCKNGPKEQPAKDRTRPPVP